MNTGSHKRSFGEIRVNYEGLAYWPCGTGIWRDWRGKEILGEIRGMEGKLWMEGIDHELCFHFIIQGFDVQVFLYKSINYVHSFYVLFSLTLLFPLLFQFSYSLSLYLTPFFIKFSY